MPLDPYDAGLLGGNDQCDVDWWQDYIRAELDRAHDFYARQFETIEDELNVANDKLRLLEQKITDAWNAV